MKKLLLLIAGFLVMSSSYAQRVNETPLEEIDVKYVEIVGIEKLLSSRVRIRLDFGQRNKLLDAKSQVLFDKRGRRIEFNSMIDALNFMSENGYDFVSSYVVSVSEQNTYHFLLKKREK